VHAQVHQARDHDVKGRYVAETIRLRADRFVLEAGDPREDARERFEAALIAAQSGTPRR
jgi:hypothetical protein